MELKGNGDAAPLKAFGKLLSERSIRPEVIEHALDWDGYGAQYAESNVRT